jgi:peroxiredoxin
MAGWKSRERLKDGAQAPAFRLRDLDGTTHTLAEILARGPAVFAFFKVSCPVCQLTFPYLERLKDNGSVQFYGVSQDDPESTREFLEDFRITFPMLLDTWEDRFPASNAFGITQVPSLFQVETDGRISSAWDGFSKIDLEQLGTRLDRQTFDPGEQVPAFRPG